MEKDSKEQADGQLRSTAARRFLSMTLQEMVEQVNQPLDPIWIKQLLDKVERVDGELRQDARAAATTRELMARLGVGGVRVGQ